MVTVDIRDTEPPQTDFCPSSPVALVTAPGSMFAELSWTTPQFSDNVGVVSTELHVLDYDLSLSPGQLPLGTHTVQYIAADEAGLTATCTFDVVVRCLS